MKKELLCIVVFTLELIYCAGIKNGETATTPFQDGAVSDSITDAIALDTEPVVLFERPEVYETYYLSIYEALKKNDIKFLDTIDFTKLRFSYYEYLKKSKKSSMGLNTDFARKVNEASGNKDYKTVALYLDSLLMDDPLNIDLNGKMAECLVAINQSDTFNFMLAKKLGESILASGNGISEKSPYRVILDNEIAGLFYMMNIEIKNSTSYIKDMYRFFIIEYVNKDGEPDKAYFQDMRRLDEEQAVPVESGQEEVH